MEKKEFVVVFVFGELAVDAYNTDFKTFRRCIKNGDGSLIKRVFNTEDEVRAYQQGVEDMDGWSACQIVADEDVERNSDFVREFIGD